MNAPAGVSMFSALNMLSAAVVVAAASITPAVYAAAPGSRSLCGSDETIYFSCRIVYGNDYASVCAKHNASPDTGYVQYRFGHDAASAFTFPATKVAPGDRFRILTINHFRNGIGKHLTFSHGAYTYVISNAVQPPEIGVFRNDKLIATKACEFDNGFTPISNDADLGLEPGIKSQLDSFDGS